MAPTLAKSYLVECYWPGVNGEKVADTERRLLAQVSSLPAEGRDIAYLGSILVPADEASSASSTGRSPTSARSPTSRACLSGAFSSRCGAGRCADSNRIVKGVERMSTLVRARRLGVAAAVAALLVGTAAVASPAGADPGVPVQIVATLTGSDFSGVWTATGAFTDAGTFARVDANVSGSVEHSARVGTVQVVLTFTGAQGTFTLRDEIMLSPDSADGTWQVASGTGAYARMSGHGRSVFVFGTDTITFTGTVSTH